MKCRTALAAVLTALAAIATPGHAADHELKMLGRGAAGMMVFEPAYLRVAPGDTVTFVPTDRSHNAESIPAMAPAGTTPFNGAMNTPVTVTFDRQGIYGYKCAPHYGMGMVGVGLVGTAAPNLDAAGAARHPG